MSEGDRISCLMTPKGDEPEDCSSEGMDSLQGKSILEEAYMVNMLEQGLSLHSQCCDVPSVSTVVHRCESQRHQRRDEGSKQ